MMTTEGEERSMLSEEVYNQPKKMIVCGKFEKGKRLVEEKLVHRVNVSRNPMRIEVLDPEPWQSENAIFYIIKDIYTKRKKFLHHLYIKPSWLLGWFFPLHFFDVNIYLFEILNEIV
jgi:hypothetical protein